MRVVPAVVKPTVPSDLPLSQPPFSNFSYITHLQPTAVCFSISHIILLSLVLLARLLPPLIPLPSITNHTTPQHHFSHHYPKSLLTPLPKITSQHHHSTPPLNTTTQHHHSTPSLNTTTQHHHSTPPLNTTTQHHHSTPPLNTITQHHHSTPPLNTTTQHHHSISFVMSICLSLPITS